MTTEEKVTFMEVLKRRFGTRPNDTESREGLVRFMNNECTAEQKELVVKYLSLYPNKMFAGGVCK